MFSPALKTDTVATIDATGHRLTLSDQYKKAAAFRCIHRWFRELVQREFVGRDGQPAARRLWNAATGEYVPKEAFREVVAGLEAEEETGRIFIERLNRRLGKVTP